MPPMFMTALVSLLLNLMAPHSSVALPHVSKIANHNGVALVQTLPARG
jgi:hypothetical protein